MNPLYSPGPYWRTKIDNAWTEIQKHGIHNFRSGQYSLGGSMSESPHLDVRTNIPNTFKGKVLRAILDYRPFKNIFESQIVWTKNLLDEKIAYQSKYLSLEPRFQELMKKFKVPGQNLGNPAHLISVGDLSFTSDYLLIADLHEHFSSHLNFSQVRSFLEIGGGYGANLDFVFANYSNVRKAIYVDLGPNLYLATMYLHSIYGPAVKDAESVADHENFRFGSDDDLEIYCILPEQLDKFIGSVDFFQNSDSFVEMPMIAAKNYSSIVEKILHKNSNIVITSYDNFDTNTTYNPDVIPSFFINLNSLQKARI